MFRTSAILAATVLAASAEAQDLGVSLPVSDFTISRGQSATITAEFFNLSTSELVILNGIGLDAPLDVLESDATPLLLNGPEPLEPGERWTGPVLVLHVPITALLGQVVTKVSFFGGRTATEDSLLAQTYVRVTIDAGCEADFDGNGTRDVPDIFAFLAAWFAQDPSADFDGNTLVQVPDIFAFLSAWFAGCP
jgi:hypothetical protein